MDLGKIIADILSRFFLSRSALERWLQPHIGTCRRCHRPWITPAYRKVGKVYYQKKRNSYWGLVGVRSHSTYYGKGKGCFAICEGCWESLPASECLPFYEQLMQEWANGGHPLSEADKAALRKAVLDGNGGGHG